VCFYVAWVFVGVFSGVFGVFGVLGSFWAFWKIAKNDQNPVFWASRVVLWVFSSIYSCVVMYSPV